jgi:hypothetical protein
MIAQQQRDAFFQAVRTFVAVTRVGCASVRGTEESAPLVRVNTIVCKRIHSRLGALFLRISVVKGFAFPQSAIHLRSSAAKGFGFAPLRASVVSFILQSQIINVNRWCVMFGCLAFQLLKLQARTKNKLKV